jgi:hypothetical protein
MRPSMHQYPPVGTTADSRRDAVQPPASHRLASLDNSEHPILIVDLLHEFTHGAHRSTAL